MKRTVTERSTNQNGGVGMTDLETMLAGSERQPYRDRIDGGQMLAACLKQYAGRHVLVLGIPRGGVPVAAEVARALDAELDVIVARKLGAPGFQELAVGAVTANGGRFLNEEAIEHLGVTKEYLNQVTEAEMLEAHRREEKFRRGRAVAGIKDRIVILVDDGLATGATMRASVRSVRRAGPAKLVAAVPVGSREACSALRREADEVVCPYEPEPFYAVGMYYRDFEATLDEDVISILDDYRSRMTASKAST
jgi:predicted phosphoribosyltransferase